MPVHPRSLAPAALFALLTASACGPISIDVAPLSSPKPGGGSPGASPSATATATPRPGVTATPTVGNTAAPSTTPTPPNPNGTPGPDATLDPNATPTPAGAFTPAPTATPGTGVSAPPGPTPSPGTGGTPVPWPSAVAVQTGTPVQGKAFEIKRDAGKPMDVAAAPDGHAWVAIGTQSPTGDVKGELVKLKPDGTPVQVLTFEGNPRRVESDGGDGVWMAMDAKSAGGMGGTTLMRLSADGQVQSKLELGYGQAYQIVRAPGGEVWVPAGNQKIYRISATGGLLGTYTPPGMSYGNMALGVDGSGFGWYVDTTNKNLLKIAPGLTEAGKFALGDVYPYTVAGTSDAVWLAYGDKLALRKLDGAPSASVATGYGIPQMRPTGDGGMWGLAITQGGGGSVVKFDASANAKASYAVGSDVRGFAVAGDGGVWAANYGPSTVTRVGTR